MGDEVKPLELRLSSSERQQISFLDRIYSSTSVASERIPVSDDVHHSCGSSLFTGYLPQTQLKLEYYHGQG